MMKQESILKKYFYLWVMLGGSILLFTTLGINQQMNLADEKYKSQIRYVMQLYQCGDSDTAMCQGIKTFLLSENNVTTFPKTTAIGLYGKGNYEIQIETLDHRQCCGEWRIMTGEIDGETAP